MRHSSHIHINKKRGIGFWILVCFSIILLIFLLIGQTFSLFNYQAAVSSGLQESVEEVSEVGIAFAKGFAFGDSIAYIPFLFLGIIGLLKRKKWGKYMMFASCAISVYWPVVHLYAIYIGKDVIILHPEKYITFPITLSIIILYGLWGMWYLYKNQQS